MHIIMDNTAMVLELAIILCAKGLYVGPWPLMWYDKRIAENPAL